MSNTHGLRRIFFGEPVPEKDDPKYKKRHEEAFAAGERFARVVGLSWLGGKFFTFGERNKKEVVIVMISIMLISYFLFLGKFVGGMNRMNFDQAQATAVERVDSALNKHYHSVETIKRVNP